VVADVVITAYILLQACFVILLCPAVKHTTTVWRLE